MIHEVAPTLTSVAMALRASVRVPVVVELTSVIVSVVIATDSEVARQILDHWTDYRSRFVKVFPNEYRRALKEIAAGQLKEAA